VSDLSSDLSGYEFFLRDLKQRIQTAQLKAVVAVNSELILLYWSIGRDILTRQANGGWGAKVTQHLSVDLQREFPEMKGFSPRNLVYMQTLAVAYSEESTQQAVARIPWRHNCVIMDKCGEI
jgi:predicted nuclease of restriction endonuclease-like (RecB) superfamily